jgi:SAM-dependent methyltransferase
MPDTISLAKAHLYEKYRLPYAIQAVDGLLERTGEVRLVADIGAGTGQLARLFAWRCTKLYAIEPDPSMRAVAALVLRDFPNVEIRPSSAEQTGLAENSIDLIVIGNAYHRFRPEACVELRRILKPGGWAALFSYTFSNRAYSEMLFSRLREIKGIAARTARAWHNLPVEALFGSAPTLSLSAPQTCREDWDAFFGAACAGIEAPEPGDPQFAHFEALHRHVFDSCAVDGELQIEYQTLVTFGQPVY